MSNVATIPDLWPTKFGTENEISPATILRQQGYILGERTDDAVYGEVESRREKSGKFLHIFYISSPLVKVREQVVWCRHGLDSYPADLTSQSGNAQNGTSTSLTVKDPSEFMEKLREMLATPSIVQLIASLVSQARDMESAI